MPQHLFVQIVTVDGDLLKSQPARVMQQLQRDLEFKSYFNYEPVLRLDLASHFCAFACYFCFLE